ncbi:MAG TPA: FAD-dependent oxidoreductase [Dehalococcoidia bacterium]|nr:FAD-dependent oxidoreductase [Dehalococcoidia bacterium]
MRSEPAFERLLEPGQIGTMTLKNRMVMPPMVTNFNSEEGFITDRTLAWYEARARGGVGLVITEAACVQAPIGRGWRYGLVADDDKFLPGLSRLAEAVHRQGAKLAMQLHHTGRAGRAAITGLDPVGPSPIPEPVADAPTPRELTTEEIAQIIECFARAAERASKAGFDAVEIHGAHRYLGAQFLSAASNQRQDVYGGSLENRARFLIEVVKAVKGRVGKDFPVWCRINGQEYGIVNGLTPSESRRIAQMLEAAGADAIHVSAWGWGVENHRAPVTDSPLPGPFAHLARGIKRAVRVPVLAVGALTPELGERLLREQSADFICFARGLIADPELPQKIASGRLEEIRPCIVCQTCVHRIRDGQSDLVCSVNAAAGRETEYTLKPADRAKKVLVVGAGPAGMEAARVAALRGHQVLLYEKGQQLGGQLLLADKPPLKKRLARLTQYLASQLGRLGVKVNLGQEATVELVDWIKPDAVIVAAGVKPFTPEIAGAGGSQVVQASDVLAGRAAVGDRVIVLGGELVGCETAEFLADMGKQVTVTRRGPEMAAQMLITNRLFLLHRLEQKGVALLPGVKYEQITEEGLTVITPQGERKTLEADTIVLAAGARPNADLYEALKGKGPEVCRIGDCLQPRGIRDAVHDGYRAALSL